MRAKVSSGEKSSSRRLPRIAFVVAEFYPINAGIANATLSFTKALAQRGYEVHVITPNWGNKRESVEVYEGVRIHRIVCHRIRFLTWLYGLRFGVVAPAMLLRIGPDMIFGEAIRHGGIASGVAGKLFRKTSITHGHGFDVHEVDHFHEKILTKLALRLNDFVLVTNSEFSDMLQSFHQRKMGILPNIVEEPLSEGNREHYKKQLHLSPHEFHCIAIGRLVRFRGVEEKGISHAMKAVQQVEGCKLHILGDGPLAGEFRDFIVSNNLEDKIIIHGRVPRETLFGFLRAADALLFPSLKEGLAMVMIEALASHLPVVTTRIGGARDYIEDGVNGIFCQPANVESIVSAVNRLKSDPALRNRIAENGYRTYLENFTPEAVVRRFESLVGINGQECCGQRRSSS